MTTNTNRASTKSRSERERGLSLVEVIVGMAVTTILLAIVATMFISVVKVTSNANSTTTRSSDGANILNEIGTVLRPAVTHPVTGTNVAEPAIVSGTPLAVTLYSLVDTNTTTPAPTKVTFSIDSNGMVIESRVAATASGKYWLFTATPTTRVLGGPVQSLTGTDALFVYFDSQNAVITPGGSGLTLAQRDAVANVQVTVNIANTLTTGADPVIIINTFGMPNVQAAKGT
jgi:Tfp pilus assembly protein PilW